MGKRKAQNEASATGANGVAVVKRTKRTEEEPVPQKRPALFDDDNSEDESDRGGVPLDGFKINEEYAKRHEHNKKREELQRCKFQLIHL